MIQRQWFIAKIRAPGYSYKSTQKRTYLYRRTGGTHYMSVPMRDKLTETYIRRFLEENATLTVNPAFGATRAVGFKPTFVRTDSCASSAFRPTRRWTRFGDGVWTPACRWG